MLQNYSARGNFFYTFFGIAYFDPESNVVIALVFQLLERQHQARHWGEQMEPAFITYIRQLCRAVAEEANPERVKALVDELAQAIDEHQLLASLL